MKKRETIDLVIILIWPIIAAILSFLLKTDALGSIILFAVIPSVFLSFRGKKYIKKSLIFSLIVSIPTIIIIDYIAEVTQQWFIPYSILPFKLFGIVTLEVILWAIFMIYYVAIFYEYFLDKHVTKRLWHPHMKYLAMLLLASAAIFMVLFFAFPSALNIPYFYLSFGVLFILIPILIELFKYSKLSSKFFKAGAYFFYLTFIWEVTALKLGWWSFPGTQFIGWVTFLGVSFPFEELFFWCILFAMAILSYYEFFEDDEK